MSNNSSYGFTTDANELVKEMGVVMNEGIVKILNKFMNRYEMLERTHQEIMRLPSVLNELNMFEPKRETKNEEQTDVKQLCERVKLLENNIDKKINNILEIVQSLNQMLVLTPKTLEKPLEPLEKPIEKPLEPMENPIEPLEKPIEKPLEPLKTIEPMKTIEVEEVKPQLKIAIVAACENENIKVDVKEEEVEEEEEEVEEEDEETGSISEHEDKEEVEEEETEDTEDIEEEETEDVEDDIETETSSEQEEKEEEKEEEEKEEEKEEEEKEEEEEELFEIDIDDTTYCTNNDENGFIYILTEDGDVGEKVGYFKESEPFFYADEN